MRLINVRLPLVIVVVASLASFPMAQAAPFAIIDQQNPGPGPGIFSNFTIVGDGVTQGFTPTLAGIDALELQMEILGTSSSIRIDIFAGDGDGGALLGSSEILNITNGAFATAHFDFAPRVVLTPNVLHTFRMTHLGGDAEAFMEVTGNNYAGGIPRNPDGTPYPTFDLVFTEGMHIPEPAGLAIAVLGFVTVGCRARKRS